MINSLQKIINNYLRLDPESNQRLNALNGKVVMLHLKGIELRVQLCFIEGKIQINPDEELIPDTIITGTPLSLLHMALKKTDRKTFFATDVSIEGDLELGQQIIDLFDQLEIDWEEKAANIVGDVPAYQLNRFARRAKQFTNRLCDTLIQNINEYTHEEIALFPPKEALQDFFDDIDHLRLDTDRIEARIMILSNKINAKKGEHS